jgi:branched-chain amino acid transport system ATP-binding protein
MSEPVLALRGVGRSYGALRVLDDVSFEVRAGARHAIIGPNGAGKSTLFAIMSGRLRPTDGTVRFRDADITASNEVHRAALGIQQTLQHSSLFTSLSVLDNVSLAVQRSAGICARWWRPANRYAKVAAAGSGYLERLGLAERADVPVAALSHGERRQLEVAVALATEPTVLMLDEPTAGMSAAETARFVELIKQLPDSMTVLFVEHDIDVVMSLSSTISVLNLGRLIATGTPAQIVENEAVRAAYLSGSSRADLFAEPAGGAA